MSRQLKVNCRVCRKELLVDLPTECAVADIGEDIFNYAVKSVTCDACMERLGRSARKREEFKPMTEPGPAAPVKKQGEGIPVPNKRSTQEDLVDYE